MPWGGFAWVLGWLTRSVSEALSRSWLFPLASGAAAVFLVAPVVIPALWLAGRVAPALASRALLPVLVVTWAAAGLLFVWLVSR